MRTPRVKCRAPLYQRLLDSDWPKLDAEVRKLHTSSRHARARGSFHVDRGKGPIVRILIVLLALPGETGTNEVNLNIILDEQGERWVRSFKKKQLVTTQREGPGRLLVERKGALEFFFRLHVIDGALVYRHEDTMLHLGPMALTLPRWMAPHIIGREAPCTGSERLHVAVSITLPLLGLLLRYEGDLKVEGPVQ